MLLCYLTLPIMGLTSCTSSELVLIYPVSLPPQQVALEILPLIALQLGQHGSQRQQSPQRWTLQAGQVAPLVPLSITAGAQALLQAAAVRLQQHLVWLSQRGRGAAAAITLGKGGVAGRVAVVVAAGVRGEVMVGSRGM
jgi:hypothetical protein